jgi:Icc-related predicted phosphoesterase
VRLQSYARDAVLEVLAFDPDPLHFVRYLNAARRGGTEVCRLEIERARVSGLPSGLDALIVTSDLQGIVGSQHGEATLLGVAVAEALEQLVFDGALPAAARTGVLLAGDFYSVPDANKRGGYGDVTPVWQAFGDRFAWTAGVAGNHDDVDGAVLLDGVHILDGDVVELDELRIGGVGLICGNPDKRGRRDDHAQLELVDKVVAAGCDVLVLHEGPPGTHDQRGNPSLRDSIERASIGLTVCGHVHWPRPLARHATGEILNVNSRTVVLTR